MGSEILGKDEAKNWIYREIPSLGNQAPINLLDTEVGHRLSLLMMWQRKRLVRQRIKKYYIGLKD